MTRTRVLLLLLLPGVDSACAGKPAPASGHVEAAQPPKKATPAWLTQFPSVCSLGESGPTLVPTDALAEARRKARTALATKSSDRKTRSATEVVSSSHQTTVRQLVVEQSNGWAESSEIVTMWNDVSGGWQYAPVEALGRPSDANALLLSNPLQLSFAWQRMPSQGGTMAATAQVEQRMIFRSPPPNACHVSPTFSRPWIRCPAQGVRSKTR
jgi:hypothetical protein